MFESFLGVNPWTALFILLNTLTIYFVAKKFLFGPVMKMITDRQQEIDNLYADAGHAKKEAQKLQEDYQKKLNEASATADQMLQQGLDEDADDKQRALACIRVDEAGLAVFYELFRPEKYGYEKNAPCCEFQYPISHWRKRKQSTMPRMKFPVWHWQLPARWLKKN